MNREEFDRLFDLALEDAAKKMPAPDPDLSWARIEDEFRRTKVRSSRKLVSLSAMAASFLLGALLFSTPAVSNAFTPLVTAVKNLQSDVVSFVFGNRSENEKLAKTASPGEQDGETLVIDDTQQAIFSSWDEARSHLSFSTPEITYVPDSFQLNHVVLLLFDETQKAKTASLIFQSEKDSFQITINSIQTKELIATGSKRSDGNHEEIEINGHQAYLFVDSKGRRSLDLMRGALMISITGTISTEELIKIAHGIA